MTSFSRLALISVFDVGKEIDEVLFCACLSKCTLFNVGVLFVELLACSRSLYLLFSFGEPMLGGIGLSILSVSICTSACHEVGLLNLCVGVNCAAGVDLKGFTS